MAAAAGGGQPAAGEGSLRALYRWVDAVPLSRPRRNIARDFSDGVLVAEVVKFFFPAMVQLHSFVPASSTPQKLANWGHLNRKVLSKLNFSVPNEVIRQIVQCRPGVVEQVLLLLRQKIEEKQKQVKAVPGPGQVSRAELGQDPVGTEKAAGLGAQLQDGLLPCPNQTLSPRGSRSLQCEMRTPTTQAWSRLGPHPTQILQMKVRRLEQLLRLKDMRIDDLSRCLQQARPQQQ
uniref:Sperm flagellar 1 n=1 Tax=Phasianus colchicus TaxID=9054 RepID=A0A669PGS5_PHACC